MEHMSVDRADLLPVGVGRNDDKAVGAGIAADIVVAVERDALHHEVAVQHHIAVDVSLSSCGLHVVLGRERGIIVAFFGVPAVEDVAARAHRTLYPRAVRHIVFTLERARGHVVESDLVVADRRNIVRGDRHIAADRKQTVPAVERIVILRRGRTRRIQIVGRGRDLAVLDLYRLRAIVAAALVVDVAVDKGDVVLAQALRIGRVDDRIALDFSPRRRIPAAEFVDPLHGLLLGRSFRLDGGRAVIDLLLAEHGRAVVVVEDDGVLAQRRRKVRDQLIVAVNGHAARDRRKVFVGDERAVVVRPAVKRIGILHVLLFDDVFGVGQDDRVLAVADILRRAEQCASLVAERDVEIVVVSAIDRLDGQVTGDIEIVGRLPAGELIFGRIGACVRLRLFFGRGRGSAVLNLLSCLVIVAAFRLVDLAVDKGDVVFAQSRRIGRVDDGVALDFSPRRRIPSVECVNPLLCLRLGRGFGRCRGLAVFDLLLVELGRAVVVIEGDGVASQHLFVNRSDFEVGRDFVKRSVPSLELVCILRVRRLLRLFARRGRRLSVLDHLHVVDQRALRVKEAHLEHLWVLFVLRLDGQVGLDRCPAVVALGDHFPADKHTYAVLFLDCGIFDLGRDRRGAEGHRRLFALLSFKPPPFECDGPRLERALNHCVDDEVGRDFVVALVPLHKRLYHALLGRNRLLHFFVIRRLRARTGHYLLRVEKSAFNIEVYRIGALVLDKMSIDLGVGRD